MSEQLSAFRIKRSRRFFDSYSAINSFSFALVTGNTITLYALALNASSTIIGILGAFMYLSFFAIPLGKIGVKKSSLIKTFANSWMLRNWSLLPLLAIPYLMKAGLHKSAIGVLLFAVFAFNFFRGIGLIANNPIISMLAPGKDRGEYIVKLSLINNATAVVATLLLAWLLWVNAGVETYNLVVIFGIITGVVASSLLFKIPDPGTPVNPETGKHESFFSSMQKANSDPNFKRFVASYIILGLGIGMVRPFIIVFSKSVYGQIDSLVTIFTVCASLGALLMGFVLRLVIDRLGAKPMYIIFSAISLFSLVPAFIAPGVGSGLFAFVFLCILAAITNMGFAGQESAAQTYFFGMVPKESMVNLSMLYFFIIGATGAIGSIFGGTVLDFFASAGLSSLLSFRLFYAASVIIIAFGIHIQKKLLDLGSFPVRDSLAVLFSPRDMRALTLLRKLDANEDPDEETEILAELGEVASSVSSEVLLAHLSSPRFEVRYEALQSISQIKRLNVKMRDALLKELSDGEFSTAALSARLLGQFKVQQAKEKLHLAVNSADYRLAGEAMLALARLGDQKGQFVISDILLATDNPFILVRGVQSMAEYGTAASIPILLDLLRNEHLPAHISDETILTVSALLGVPKKFFYAYETYVCDRTQALRIIKETYDELSTKTKRCDIDLKKVVEDFLADPTLDSPFVHWVLSYRKSHTGVYSALLMSVALDAELNNLESFRFFLCFWVLSVFANPKLIEK